MTAFGNVFNRSMQHSNHGVKWRTYFFNQHRLTDRIPSLHAISPSNQRSLVERDQISFASNFFPLRFRD